MKRDLDVVDLLVAVGLATGIFLWAILWAYPYPHPDLWPFLATAGSHIPLGVFSTPGKLALGAFASLVYLIVRSAWIRFRNRDDVLPDKFFFTRFSPLCGAAVFALSPLAWRSAQHLSPGFVLVLMTAFACLLWQRGRGFRNVAMCLFAYVLLAFVAGLSPLGLLAIAYVITRDILRRWKSAQKHGQREDDEDARHKRSLERTLSIVGGLIGFGAAVYVGSLYYSDGDMPKGIVTVFFTWWRGWFSAALGMFRSVQALVMAVGVGFVAASLALGRRMRAHASHFHSVAVSLSCCLALVAAGLLLRTVDSDERVRLTLMRDYVRSVLADADGAQWLFTDGRFDDALSYEIARRGMKICILNALVPPSRAESERLRALAPEPGDRGIFAAGGAEVFKAWADERPDRLAMAAWQLGTSVVRRFDRVRPRTNGSVMRTADEATREAAALADRRFVQLTRDVLHAIGQPSSRGAVFGSVDDAVARRFDALVWRTARMASERSEAAARAGQMNVAQAERDAMQTLDAANESLRAQGEVVERLLPTASLVLTPREALEVSLKRADFALAERYAREVLLSSPDDARALFALGMAGLEAGEFFNAIRHFERVLKTRPNEPATLNNLALAYLKLGRREEAKRTAEKALESNPNSPEIRKNLAEILKAQQIRPAQQK